MATSRHFAFNTGSTITGTLQVGDLAIGVDELRYDFNVGGVQWWEGPDEDLGWVIGYPNYAGNQPNPLGIDCYVQFWRSPVLSEESFVNTSNRVTHFSQNFTNGLQSSSWLLDNGYWNNFTGGTSGASFDSQIFPLVTHPGLVYNTSLDTIFVAGLSGSSAPTYEVLLYSFSGSNYSSSGVTSPIGKNGAGGIFLISHNTEPYTYLTLVTGGTPFSYFIKKLDNNGNTQYSKTYPNNYTVNSTTFINSSSDYIGVAYTPSSFGNNVPFDLLNASDLSVAQSFTYPLFQLGTTGSFTPIANTSYDKGTNRLYFTQQPGDASGNFLNYFGYINLSNNTTVTGSSLTYNVSSVSNIKAIPSTTKLYYVGIEYVTPYSGAFSATTIGYTDFSDSSNHVVHKEIISPPASGFPYTTDWKNPRLFYNETTGYLYAQIEYSIYIINPFDNTVIDNFSFLRPGETRHYLGAMTVGQSNNTLWLGGITVPSGVPKNSIDKYDIT